MRTPNSLLFLNFSIQLVKKTVQSGKLKELELPQFPSTEIIASIPVGLWFLLGFSSL